MMRFVSVILFCMGVVAAVHVDKCKEIFGPRDGSFGTANLEDVRVNDCEEPPCALKKGSDSTIAFDFIPDKNYEKLITNVFGGIGIIRVPFREIHGANACKDIIRKSDNKTGCPVEAGMSYTYSNTFPILKAYPSVNVQVQYGLNDGKNPVVCFSLPAKISN